MKKNYLSIDTTTEACSVALDCSGDLRSRYTEKPRMHAKLVLPMVDELLADAGITLNQVSGIAFCQGPGAFTGLRIGAGVVQGLAFSADLPVLGVSTLAAIAQRAFRENQASHVHAAIDARMGEIYWGSYRLGCGDNPLMELQGAEVVVEPGKIDLRDVMGESFVRPNQETIEWVGCGTGWAFNDSLEQAGVNVIGIYEKMLPHALDAMSFAVPGFSAGLGVAAEYALPHYVRNNVAKKKSEQGS